METKRIVFLVAVYLVLNKYVETLLHEGSKLILVEAHTLETGDILGIIFSGDGHIGEGGHRREFLDTLDGGQVGFFVLEEFGGHILQEKFHGLGAARLLVVVFLFQLGDVEILMFIFPLYT